MRRARSPSGLADDIPDFASAMTSWPRRSLASPRLDVLAVALDSISTVANGTDVFPCTFNGIARRQGQYRAAKRENCQKPFHRLSPTASANWRPLETTALRSDRSVALTYAGQKAEKNSIPIRTFRKLASLGLSTRFESKAEKSRHRAATGIQGRECPDRLD